MAAGDEQVAAQHRRGLRTTLFGTAGALGAVGLVHFLGPLFGTGGSTASAPRLISGFQAVLNDMTAWLLGLVPVGGGLIAAYHWFMSGPGAA